MNPLPNEIRAHSFVRHYHCAEEARLRIVENVRPSKLSPEIAGGIAVDEWLKKRPRSKQEEELTSKLIPYEPFHRMFDGGVKIIIHPDDLRLEFMKVDHGFVRFVAIEEYKTTKSLRKDEKTGEFEYDFYGRKLAEFQVGIYAWVLYPILKDLGYRLSSFQLISMFRRRDGMFLKRYRVKVDFADIEEKLRTILKIWRGELPPIPPQDWKCRFCDPEFKSRCTIHIVKTSLEHLRRHAVFYLAGPIGFTVGEEHRVWRNDLREFLTKLGCGFLDPLDKYANRSKEVRDGLNRLRDQGKYGRIRSFARKHIIPQDLALVDAADGIIAYVPEYTPGTAGEILYGFLHKKCVLIVCPMPPTRVANWMIGCSTKIFPNFVALKRHLKRKLKK
jgi:nucleoside 2-deoxyribosyltransferase/CRISPR/Cas system-associated exonuclease Cas4 (RecB family)